jgi:hypothetical protein
MHAHGKFALALSFSLMAGTLQAAPWEHAGSKIQTENNYNGNQASSNQTRRSTRAYSYSPATANAAPTVAQPRAMAPAAVAPRVQASAPMTVAPTTVAPRQPATTYAPRQARGYRSYSYQPSTTNGYNYNTRSRARIPSYLRADSKVLGRQGY